MQQKQSNQDQEKQDIELNDTDRTSIVEEIQEEIGGVVAEARQEVMEAQRPWYEIVKWDRILITVSTMLFMLFALLSWWVLYHPIMAIDVAITRAFQEYQSPWFIYTMMAVSYIGDKILLAAGLVIVAIVLLWVVDLRLEAIMIATLSTVSSILNVLIKNIVERPRPTANLVNVIQPANGSSFPSGHVMAYVAFWGLLFAFGIILFEGKYWWRTALLIISGLCVVLVGPSRIYLGAHWASDVLGAYLIGGFLLGVTLWIYLFLKGRGVLAPRSARAKDFREKYIN